MELDIHNFLKKHHMIQAGDALLIAVSGGPDSMALLHWLVKQREKLNLKLRVIHVNHQLRGDAADADQEYVEGMCQQWEVACTSVVMDVEAYAKENRMSKQAAARACRYQAFKQTAERYGLRKVAMAHHADDQVETVLMRMIRGAGLQGLSGIPPYRAAEGFVIVRPFLELSRKTIEEYCHYYQIEPREDQSNLTDDYTRNYLRHHVTPLLAQLNPKLQMAIGEMSDVLREENDWLEQEAKKYVQQVMELKKRHKITINLSKFRHIPLPLQRRAILLILNCLPETDTDWSKKHIDQLLRVCIQENGNKELHLPYKILARKEYTTLTLIKRESEGEHRPAQQYISLRLPNEGELEVPEMSLRVTIRRQQGFALDLDTLEPDEAKHVSETTFDQDASKHYTAYFDTEQLELPLTIRNRRTGDKFQPLGMKGHKKVKDIFIDAKIPLRERHTWPLITDQTEILWIPGIKRGNRSKVDQNTKQWTIITVEKF